MSSSLLYSPHYFCCSTTVLGVYLHLCLLPATYAQHLRLMRIWEGMLLSLSFILFRLLILPPLLSGCTGEWKKEFSQIYAFFFMYSCMCLGILPPGPSLLSIHLKFHRILWFSGFSDRRMIIGMWSVSGSGADQLLHVSWSCCLSCLRNRRNWLLYRLRAGAWLLFAVSLEQWKMTFFHAGSFPHELSVRCAN